VRQWRGRLAGFGLRRPSDVAVMQATDFANRDDRAELRRLDRASVRCILVEREMRARPMIVREVADEDVAEMPFAQDQNVIQTLAPDRTDKALREGILPRAVRSCEDFTDPHALHALPKRVPVHAVAIPEEIGGCGVVREGVHDLLGGPVGGGVLGHVEMDDAAAIVSEHEENEEDAQARGGNGEEIEGDQIQDMVGEERPPSLGRRGGPLRKQAGHGALGHIEAELQKLAVDSRGAPEGVRGVAMRVIKALIAAWTGGRPPVGRPERGELPMAAEEEGEEPKQVEQESDHRAEIVAGSEPTDQRLDRRPEFWRRTGYLARWSRTKARIMGFE
jgi:hypothetical protein